MDTDRTHYIDATALPWRQSEPGVERKILGYDDELMMMHVRFTKNAVGYVHSHPHRQVTYIESGSFEVTIGNEKKLLRKGDCYFIPPDIPHGVTALEDASLIDVFAPCRTDIIAKDI